MAVITNSFEEELAALGIVGSYIWKPNRLYARDGNSYRSVDAVSDGPVNDIVDAVTKAGNLQIDKIKNEGENQIAELNSLEKNFNNYKANLIQTYTRLQNFYLMHRMEALASIMQTAIFNLNQI